MSTLTGGGMKILKRLYEGMCAFCRGIFFRNGEGSSKKLGYLIACVAATVVLLWLTYKLDTPNGVEDWVFVWIYAIYLITVGGFEILLQFMNVLVQWRAGKPSAAAQSVPETKTEAG